MFFHSDLGFSLIMRIMTKAVSPTSRAAAGLAVLLAGFGLAGCAAVPSATEVEERFLIEFAGGLGTTAETLEEIPEMGQLARDMAADAADGACSNEQYFSALDGSAQYAFGVMCSMYYESEMSENRLDWVKQQVLERVTEDLSAD